MKTGCCNIDTFVICTVIYTVSFFSGCDFQVWGTAVSIMGFFHSDWKIIILRISPMLREIISKDKKVMCTDSGQVAQLVRVLPQYSKVECLIPNQCACKKQPINA